MDAPVPTPIRRHPSQQPGADAPAALDISIDGPAGIIRLRGDLDGWTGDRLTDAVAWLRRRYAMRPIAIDSSAVGFVDVGGLRALHGALDRPDGSRDPLVFHVVGPAVARLESVLARANHPARSRRHLQLVT